MQARRALGRVSDAASAMVLAVAAVGCGGAEVSASEPETSHPLGFLSGFWSATEGTHTLFEVWSAPREGSLYGFNLDFSNEDQLHHELMRLTPEGGGFVYTAWPEGQSRTTFTSRDLSDTSATFENPTHDFPKRVTYTRRGDVLVASIAGDAGERTASWRFRRTGDAVLTPIRVRACVDAEGARIHFDLGACYCGPQIFAEAYETGGRSDVQIVIVDYMCDACERGTVDVGITTPALPVHLFGEPLLSRVTAGECHEGTYPILVTGRS